MEQKVAQGEQMLARIVRGAKRIFIACGHTDLRYGIDGLASRVQLQIGEPSQVGNIYLFCGRKPDRIKVLCWDSNGCLVLYKRLETGKFQWPRKSQEIMDISQQQCRWLLEGLSIEQPKALKAVEKVILYD